jgi:hypothetical protein
MKEKVKEALDCLCTRIIKTAQMREEGEAAVKESLQSGVLLEDRMVLESRLRLEQAKVAFLRKSLVEVMDSNRPVSDRIPEILAGLEKIK